jgi:thiol:disulfide interchange protein DsbA
MKKAVIEKTLLLLAALLMTGAVQAQAGASTPYQEGVHYVLLQDAPAISTEPMELVEAFSYLCTHCNTFEPYINSWKTRKPEHVGFSRIPIVFGRGPWELYARGYVTSRMMGIGDDAHTAMMDVIWKEKAVMRSMEDIAAFYAGFGVSAKSFLATSKSFAVDAKMRKNQRLAQSWEIRGTPSLVLNGKYRIAGNAAVPSYDVMLDVVDYLIELDTAARLAQTADEASSEKVEAESADEGAPEPTG